MLVFILVAVFMVSCGFGKPFGDLTIPLGPLSNVKFDNDDKGNLKVDFSEGFNLFGIGAGRKHTITAGETGVKHTSNIGATVGNQTFGVEDNFGVEIPDNKTVKIGAEKGISAGKF